MTSAPVYVPPPSFLDRRPAFLPCLIAAVFALIGAGLLPYDYYVFLRCLLTITAVFVAVHAVRSERQGWLALAIPMFIIWAPAAFIPITKPVFEVLDVAVAVALIVAGSTIPAPKVVAGSDGKPVKRWDWWKIALLVYVIGAFAASVTVYSTGGNSGCELEYDRTGPYCA